MKSTSLVVLLFLAAVFAMTNATETFRRLDQESSIGKKSKRHKSESTGSDSGKSQDESEEYMSMHIMSLHHQSMSFELSMSYTPTGKGSKGSKSKGEKNSKSGKSKGSKSGKKSSKKGESGKGKGGGSDHPMPAPSSDESRPPTPVSSPSEMPPSVAGLQAVELSRYGIMYTLSESLMPMREDYLEVEAVTNTYFNEYMLDVFEEPGVESLLQFRTTLYTSEFKFDEPVLIVFDSVAYFAEDFPADDLPSPQTLETLLQLSLEDPSGYLGLLAELGIENAFSTTTEVVFSNQATTTASDQDEADTNTNNEGSGSARSSHESDGAGTVPAAIAAGAVGASLLIAGIVIYRQRTADSDDLSFTKGHKQGDATVAGETFTGESYDGAISEAAPSSNRQLSADEEDGMINVDLDETTQSSDLGSISPSWDQQRRYSSATESCTYVSKGTSADDSIAQQDAGYTMSSLDVDAGEQDMVLEEDKGVDEDIMSVYTPESEVGSLPSNRRPLSVEEIETMLDSKF